MKKHKKKSIKLYKTTGTYINSLDKLIGSKASFCFQISISFVLLLTLLVGMSCSKRDNLTDEAVKKVDEIVFEKYFLREGNDWYSKSNAGFIQIKVVNIISSCRNLTEADKLNNVEWSGYVTLECSSVRDYNLNINSWDSWRDTKVLGDFKSLKVRIEKIKDKWEIGEISAGDTHYSKYFSQKPDKSEIPK